MAEEMEGWGTGEGLLSDCEATIADAWFGPQPEAEGEMAERRYLFLQLVNIEADEDEYDEWTERLTIGNGWEELDGGERIERVDGKKALINKNTDYGRIINRALGQGKEGKNFGDAFDGLAEELQSRGTQFEAEVWKGLRFKFEREEYSAEIGGEQREWNRLMPVEYVGVDDKLGGGSSTKGKAAGNSTGDLEGELKELAEGSDSHSDFVKKAMKVKGVRSDDDLLARVMDDSDDGIYAEVNA